MSINFSQFPAPRLPLAGGDFVVGYQFIGSIPTLAQYTLTQMFTGAFPGGVVPVTQGGTGLAAVPAGNVLVGGSASALNFAPPSVAGTMLISQGVGLLPAFGNNAVIIGGSVNNSPVGATTPSTGAFTALSSTSGALNGTLGGTTPSTVAATTITASGTFTPAQVAGIVGTTTNNSAQTGSVGEYLTATSGAIALVSNTPADTATVSLTPGDWDVQSVIQYAPAASTVMQSSWASVNTVTNTLPALGGSTQNNNFGNTAAQGSIVTSPTVRVSLAAATTVRAIATAFFITSTCTATGFIRARRVR